MQTPFDVDSLTEYRNKNASRNESKVGRQYDNDRCDKLIEFSLFVVLQIILQKQFHFLSLIHH